MRPDQCGNRPRNTAMRFWPAASRYVTDGLPEGRKIMPFAFRLPLMGAIALGVCLVWLRVLPIQAFSGEMRFWLLNIGIASSIVLLGGLIGEILLRRFGGGLRKASRKWSLLFSEGKARRRVIRVCWAVVLVVSVGLPLAMRVRGRQLLDSARTIQASREAVALIMQSLVVRAIGLRVCITAAFLEVLWAIAEWGPPGKIPRNSGDGIPGTGTISSMRPDEPADGD